MAIPGIDDGKILKVTTSELGKTDYYHGLLILLGHKSNILV
jgi:hypothetical protein